MAEQTEGVKVEIGADAKKLVDEFNKAQVNVQKALGDMTKSLKNMEAQSKKTGEQISKNTDKLGKGFDGLKKGLGELTTKFLAFAAALLSVEALKKSVDDTIKLRDETDKLSQNLGVSIEKASSYVQAIRDLDVSQEEANGAFSKVNETLAKSEERLTKWGVVVRDGNGHLKSQEEVFKSALQAVGSYENGSDRAAAAQAILGVSLETANKLLGLNAEALDAAKQKQELFGNAVDGKGKEAMENYKTAMTDLGSAIDGIKNTIADNLIPIITDMAEFFAANASTASGILTTAINILIDVFNTLKDIVTYVMDQVGKIIHSAFGDAGDDTNTFKEIMEVLFGIIKAGVAVVVGVIAFMAEQIISKAKMLGIAIGALIETFKALINLDFSAVRQNAVNAFNAIEEEATRSQKRLVKIAQDTSTAMGAAFKGTSMTEAVIKTDDGSEGGLKKTLDEMKANYKKLQDENQRIKDAQDKGDNGGHRHVTTENQKPGADDSSKLQKAQLAAVKAALADQLKLLQANLEAQKNALDDALSQNLISYKDYYAQADQMARDEMNKQIEMKQAELAETMKVEAAAKTASDKLNAQTQIKSIQNDINILKIKEGEIERQNARALRDKLEDFRKMKDTLAADLGDALGITDVTVQFKKVEDQYKDMKERLAAEGDKEGQGLLEKLLDIKKAELDIKKFQEDYDNLDAQMSNKVALIDLKAKQMGLTDNQVQKEKLDLYQKEIDALIEIKNKQIEVAAATYGANSKQVADLKGVVIQLESLKTPVNDVASAINNQLETSFQDLFTSVMTGSKSLKDVLNDFVNSIVASISKIAAQNLANALFNTGASSGGSGGGGGLGSLIAKFGSLFSARANGGSVLGGSPYLIGENGPELFVPGQSGAIVNNAAMRTSRTTGQGGGNGAVYNFNFTTPDPHSFKKTKTQTMAELSKTVQRANNRNN